MLCDFEGIEKKSFVLGDYKKATALDQIEEMTILYLFKMKANNMVPLIFSFRK